MLSTATFKSLWPEFVKIPDDFIQSRLDQAAARINPEIWADKTDMGHGYLTAHLLATSPYGQNARLVSDKGETTYNREYVRLQAEVAALIMRVV
jgi:hypothetical protein